jgi:hypothetical protein
MSLDRAVEDGRRVAATDELFDAYCSRLVTAEAALFVFLVTRATPPRTLAKARPPC